MMFSATFERDLLAIVKFHHHHHHHLILLVLALVALGLVVIIDKQMCAIVQHAAHDVTQTVCVIKHHTTFTFFSK